MGRRLPPPSAALGPLALALAGACGGPGEGPPSVLLVVVDTLRADHLGCYGYDQPTSPRIDALAAEGVRFETTLAHVPQTLPSICTLLTGRHPPSHGVRANGVFALPEEARTAAELYAEAGYETAAFVAAFPLDARFGAGQGFELYDDELRWNRPMRGLERGEGGDWTWMGHSTESFESHAAQVAERVLAWLDRPRERPFFALVHFFDPHHDYAPPEQLAARFEHPYDGEIANVDRELGRVLDALAERGLAERTLVAFTADHGECLGRWGRVYHQPHVSSAALHVPLVLRLSGVLPAGRVVTGLSRSVDVLPTLLELCGLPAPDGLEGRSLVPAVERGATGIELAYFETLYGLLESDQGVSRRGVTDGRWKLVLEVREDAEGRVLGERAELYDLHEDPGETRDLSEREPERLRALRERYDAFVREHPPGRARAVTPDEEVARRLEALGYL